MVDRQPGDPALPLAHPVRDRPDRHHPGLGAARLHPACTCMGITSNIMSLAGIAISIGVLVDGAIVEVENAYKKLERWERRRAAGRLPRGAPARRCRRSGPSVFFSLLVIAVAFLPDLHAGRPGGPALQAARLDQEPRDGDRRAARHHPRPGAAHARSRAWTPFTFRPRCAGRLCNAGRPSARYYPEERTRSAASLFARLRAGLPLRAAASRGRRSSPRVAGRGHHGARLPRGSAPSSCRRSTKGRILYMPTTLPGISVDRGAAASCRRRTASCVASPRSSASSARPAAPRPPPTRRRSR